jgi:hypothetical protein
MIMFHAHEISAIDAKVLLPFLSQGNRYANSNYVLGMRYLAAHDMELEDAIVAIRGSQI